ncbi:hypothetical protein IWX90DRAFT_516368 [Phyllosticta citrichinensis]|uniref:Uncharacterized protein n=1 Tax=Phyllosticta citrichinensis TaxID=1130410 RepID=A0ABR1XIV1_9PEZI
MITEERDASAQAYVMIWKGGKMWPAVRCRLPMEVPPELKREQPTPFHTCVFIPVVYEFHWMMETELSTFDNGELGKFAKADEPKRFEAFWTIVERVVDEIEPDYGWWASEILAHKLHKDFHKNDPDDHADDNSLSAAVVVSGSSDSELEIISATKVAQGTKPRASGSMKPVGKDPQSRMAGTAKVDKSFWLSSINWEATRKLEEKEKRTKKRSIYIPDEVDDEPPRPRKKVAKSSPAKASKKSGNVLHRAMPLEETTGDKPLYVDEDVEYIDGFEELMMEREEKEETEEGSNQD